MRYSSLRALFCLGAALAATAPLAGCVVAAVGGAAAGGYTLATEERSPEQLAQDAAIGSVAHKAWADYNVDLARDLTATVYDGRLLITGIVPTAEWKEKAQELCNNIAGVKEINNEVQVGQPTNLAQDARDNIASNTLRAQLLTDSQVRSSNFTVHTLDGIVYVLGYARNEAERDRVLSYARNLSNVRRVVAFIRVGAQSMSREPPPPSSTPANASAPPAPLAPTSTPTPRDTIEVTPLK
jgi:osmotically-inducible protein OsmY